MWTSVSIPGQGHILGIKNVATAWYRLHINLSEAFTTKYAKLYSALQEAQKQLVEKEKMEHEIKLAANVQRSLLPVDLPEDVKFSVDAYLEPARVVGGDFYDVIRIDNEHLGLLVADVADKGIRAAMSMAVTRTLFLPKAAARTHRPRSPAPCIVI